MLPMLVASMVSSCVYDDDLWDGKQEGETDKPKGGIFSVALRIRSVDDGFSRADDDPSTDDILDGGLIDGDPDEQRIGNNGNFVIFFDSLQNFHSTSLLTLDVTTNNEPDVLEKVYRTSFNPDDFKKLPKYCAVLLNAPEYYKIFSQFDSTHIASEVLNQLIKPDESGDPRRLCITDDGLFTMSNSTYFNKDGELQTLVAIKDSCIIESTDTKEQIAEKIINVYVERLASKFTLEVKNEDFMSENGTYVYDPHPEQIIFFDDYDDIGFPKFKAQYWQVEVTGWGVNAWETSTYLFKQLDGSGPGTGDWNWIDSNAYRTYWGVDEHYEGKYPWQYRRSDNLIGGNVVNYYADFEDRGINNLRNYSHNDLSLGNISTLSRVIYANENTYDYDAIADDLDGRCDLLAGTHVLIGARLLVEDKDGNYKAGDWFRDRNGIYYESEENCFGYVIHSFNKEMAAQNSMRYVFYNWEDNLPSEANAKTNPNGTVLYARPMSDYNKFTYKIYWVDQNNVEYELNEETIPECFDFENYNKVMADGCIQYGDGKRMPWPRTGSLRVYAVSDDGVRHELEIYSKDERTDQYTFVRNANINDIKSLLYEWEGALDHFNLGKMYYAAPAVIKKSNDGRDHCGVVRNAWYKYTLSKIGSIGSPIDEPSQPIVPYLTNINDQININVEIKHWHVVPTYIDDDDFPF